MCGERGGPRHLDGHRPRRYGNGGGGTPGAVTQELDTRSSSIPHGQPVTHWKPGVAVSSTCPGGQPWTGTVGAAGTPKTAAPAPSAATTAASANRLLVLPLEVRTDTPIPASALCLTRPSLMFAWTSSRQPPRRVRGARRDFPDRKPALN